MKELRSYQRAIQDEGVEEAFPRYANQRSDCSSFARHGDLGFFERGQMQKAFEDVSFALKLGEMSDVCSTDSGYHLIFRIG